MCIGLGLIFVAAGDQGEIQGKSGEGGLPWLGGLTIPFARFVGGAAISFLLLTVLAFLAPWISVDTDRYARVVIRANASLKNYVMSVRTNDAGLIGSIQGYLSGTPTDFKFIVFASDLTSDVTDLTLSADTLTPDQELLNKIEISEIPIDTIREHIGRTKALFMHLDLKKGTLRVGEKCYGSRGSDTNPCAELRVVGSNRQSGRLTNRSASIVSSIRNWLTTTANAQTLVDVNSLVTSLGSPIPDERTAAYSALLAKGKASLPTVIPSMTELIARGSLNDAAQAAAYYRFLNLTNLSVELTNRGLDETNLYRSIIASGNKPGTRSLLVDGLAKLAIGPDRSLRTASTHLLENIADNNTVLQLVSALNPPLTDDGRINLLNALVSVSGFACKENADAIKVAIDRIASQSLGPEFAQTNKAISTINSALGKNQNRNISCDEYWKNRT